MRSAARLAPNGANRKSKSKSLKNHTRQRRQAQESEREIAVYHGQHWAGHVKQNGQRWDAFATSPTYRHVGSYGSQSEAADAVDAANGDGS